MNSRERIFITLDHEEPDRIPIDLGSSFVTGITKTAYINLMNYLDKSESEVQLYDTIQQLVCPTEELLRELQIDVRGIVPNIKRKNPDVVQKGSSLRFTDEWGVTWEMPEGSLYFNLIDSPLSGEITAEEIENFDFPDTADPNLIEGLAEKALQFYDEGYAVILESVCAGVFEMSCRIRGTEYFLMDLLTEPELACMLMDKIVEAKIRFYEMASERLGRFVQFVREGDDVAGQESLIVSPEIYRNLIKPRHEKLLKAQKELFPQPFYCFFHSDGYIYDILPDLIGIGVEILNPVQVTGKSLEEIKREFGKDISFWGGGCDTQKILPFGTPDEVREDVINRIKVLSVDGGFIFCPVHNIQADVAPENIVAMYDAFKEHCYYL